MDDPERPEPRSWRDRASWYHEHGTQMPTTWQLAVDYARVLSIPALIGFVIVVLGFGGTALGARPDGTSYPLVTWPGHRAEAGSPLGWAINLALSWSTLVLFLIGRLAVVLWIDGGDAGPRRIAARLAVAIGAVGVTAITLLLLWSLVAWLVA